MELMEQCGDQLEICIGANPALKGTTSADLMTFFEALSSDQHIGERIRNSCCHCSFMDRSYKLAHCV